MDEGPRQVGRVLLLRHRRQRPPDPPRAGPLVGGAWRVHRRLPGQRRVRHRAARPAQRDRRQPRHHHPRPDLRRGQDAGPGAARASHQRRPVRRHDLDGGLPADGLRRGPEPLRRPRQHAADDPARARGAGAQRVAGREADVARGRRDLPVPGAAPLAVAQRPAGLHGRPAGPGPGVPAPALAARAADPRPGAGARRRHDRGGEARPAAAGAGLAAADRRPLLEDPHGSLRPDPAGAGGAPRARPRAQQLRRLLRVPDRQDRLRPALLLHRRADRERADRRRPVPRLHRLDRVAPAGAAAGRAGARAAARRRRHGARDRLGDGLRAGRDPLGQPLLPDHDLQRALHVPAAPADGAGGARAGARCGPRRAGGCGCDRPARPRRRPRPPPRPATDRAPPAARWRSWPSRRPPARRTPRWCCSPRGRSPCRRS